MVPIRPPGDRDQGAGGRRRVMKKVKRPCDEPRRQVAAMPVRRRADGATEILLVTSRTTQRWIVPKGWPVKGLKDREAAAREALEEAGVAGPVARKPVGRYSYWKRQHDHFTLCAVDLYLLHVIQQLPSWAEQSQRRCEWFSLEDAADLVDEPALGSAIRALAPDQVADAVVGAT